MLENIFNWLRKNLWGVLTLVVVSIVCFFIVEFFKKPGQLTVLEANVMDMGAMVPPIGALPVAIEKAGTTEIEGTITYTGTVQAYEDEDVYPRITGRIVKMPVYPGDRVKKGQLLVKLDANNSEYKARLDAAKHQGDAKMHEAGMARQDFEEAKYTLRAAEQAEVAASNEVDETKASYDYWVPEIKRQEALYKDDVVSKEEYDDEYAKFKAAKAKLDKAKAKSKEATNTKLAAKAAFDKAVHHVGHEFSASEEARAVEQTARIIDDYREIRASSNGVVTKRVISPGVVVEPGMLILKVAHIDRVRIQAEVSNTDIDKINLGDKVNISRGEGSSISVKGRITSIFPAADKRARTSIVEALIDNVKRQDTTGGEQVDSTKQYRFLPGQYVVMDIVTGDKTALTVPTEAIFYREGKPYLWLASGPGSQAADKETIYTCPMHPEVKSDKPGKCPKCSAKLVPKELGGKKLAKLVEVKTGLSNANRTEILDGIKAGDEVIYKGYGDLQPEVPVVAATYNKSGDLEKLPRANEVAGNRLSKGNNWSLKQMVQEMMVGLSIEPEPPANKNNSLIIELSKHGGGKVKAAKITGKSSMPSMDMKGPDLSAEETGDGRYRMKCNFHSGLWQVNLLIKDSNKEATRLVVDVEVP